MSINLNVLHNMNFSLVNYKRIKQNKFASLILKQYMNTIFNLKISIYKSLDKNDYKQMSIKSMFAGISLKQ